MFKATKKQEITERFLEKGGEDIMLSLTISSHRDR